jgi:HEAT repeat protein
MNEEKNPNGFGAGDLDTEDSDWGAGEKKITRGNLGAIVVVLLLLALGAVVGVFWYMDNSSKTKWEDELKVAMNLPDGEFEPALRSIMARADRPDILAQVAYELGVAGDEQAAGVLTKAIAKGGDVARESAKALAKIGGEEAKGAIDGIYAEMQKSTELTRAEFAWALCTLGDKRGFEPLLEAVAQGIISPSSLPEFNAEIIVRMGTTDKLIEMTSSADAAFRRYAAWELGFRTDHDVVPALLKLLKDDNEAVAEAAAISLGRTTDDRAGPALLEVMVSKESLRDSVLSAISQSVGAPGLEIVYKNINNDPDFKYKIIGKLKSLRDPRSTDLLIGILDEEFPATDEKSAAKLKEIRNQALWTLEEIGDPRIAEAMFQKTQWEHLTEEQIEDDATRYRQNDMSRKIANSVVSWFGKVRPESTSEYLMAIYEANKPYTNTAECAQRVKVDIGPLMEAMGRSGNAGFCPVIQPFLTQENGFYFQSASRALARLSCKSAIKSFMKLIEMTAKERKDGAFSSLVEGRNWQLEKRLQQRRNAVIALGLIGVPEAGDKLMRIVLDVSDDPELRKEAATALAYSATDGLKISIAEKVKDNSLDPLARSLLIQSLVVHPSKEVVNVMFGVLEGDGPRVLIKPAGIVIGEAGDAENHPRLAKLLDDKNEEKQRAAALALLLSGGVEYVSKIIALLDGVENKMVLKEWYEKYPVVLNADLFDSKRIFRRLLVAEALVEKTEKTGESIAWPWRHLVHNLKNGGRDAPGALTKVQIRNALMDAVRTDAAYAELAANLLSSLNERGHLLALQDEKGPQGDIARNVIRDMNLKSR